MNYIFPKEYRLTKKEAIFSHICKDGSIARARVINKEDLTTQWLKENCELTDDGLSWDEEECANGKPCSVLNTGKEKYKCGEYTMEVIQ